jgi:hypothetical protein
MAVPTTSRHFNINKEYPAMFIYKQPQYCIYLTVYYGNKLPPFYIGSSLVKYIENGYRGSVKSKKYKETYRKELSENGHLFKTIIIKKYYSRKYAMFRERNLQEKLNVVQSDMYMNMSIAKDFGWFGMKAKGVDNPVYGKRWKKTLKQIENNKLACKKAFSKPEHKEKMSKIRKNKVPKSKEQIQEKIKIYTKILQLYESKPQLNTRFNYVRQNGKLMTYERAFSKEYCEEFNLSSNGLYNIITKDNLIKKML